MNFMSYIIGRTLNEMMVQELELINEMGNGTCCSRDLSCEDSVTCKLEFVVKLRLQSSDPSG